MGSFCHTWWSSPRWNVPYHPAQKSVCRSQHWAQVFRKPAPQNPANLSGLSFVSGLFRRPSPVFLLHLPAVDFLLPTPVNWYQPTLLHHLGRAGAKKNSWGHSPWSLAIAASSVVWGPSACPVKKLAEFRIVLQKLPNHCWNKFFLVVVKRLVSADAW